MKFLKTLEHRLKYFRIQRIIFICVHNKTRAFILKLVTCHGFWAFGFWILPAFSLIFDTSCSQSSWWGYEGIQDDSFSALSKQTCIGKGLEKWWQQIQVCFYYTLSWFFFFLKLEWPCLLTFKPVSLFPSKIGNTELFLTLCFEIIWILMACTEITNMHRVTTD